MTRPLLPAATLPGALAATLLAAVAAWLSQSTLAVGGPDGARIGLLPLSPFAIAAALLAGAAVMALARAGASLTPVWLLTVIVLPWLPLPVPTVFLMWAGSIRWLIWTAVALIMIATYPGAPRLLARARSLVRNRPQVAAGVFAFAIFAFAAWQVSPSVPGGDEPHYLVITQSLLLDGDLKIENNHRRGDYQAYYAGPLAPHYIRRGTDGEIYSIHAPGLAAIVAPAFAIGGYRAVVLLLLVIASCGSALAWHLAWQASGRVAAAWFGWAAVTLAATTIFHSFTVYPDGPASVIALTGVWALMRAEEERRTGETRLRPWLLHGAALALLPWLHSRFALLAGCLGALVLLRLSATKHPAGKAVAFLSVPALSAVLWMNFFRAIYGVADPSAPYGTVREFSLGFIPGGLAGLLFDQRFGLVANAPALIVGLAGLLMMLRALRQGVGGSTVDSGGLADRRLALELLFVMVPYLLVATSYAMWWAGWSAPARFANPAVLILAIPCAVAWSRIENRGSRAVAAGLLAFTGFLSFVLVVTDGGRLAYNTRETTALWLAWASTLAPIAEGSPDLVPGPGRRVCHRHRSVGGGDGTRLVVRARARRQPGSARARPPAHGHRRGSHHRRHGCRHRRLGASWRGTRAGGAGGTRRPPPPRRGAASACRPGDAAARPCCWTAAPRCCRSSRRSSVPPAGAGAATRPSPSCRRCRRAATWCASRAADRAA